MSNEDDDIKTAASKLVGAMSGLLRAIDAIADENPKSPVSPGGRGGHPLFLPCRRIGRRELEE
jgi:hypothetical protein